MGIDFEDIKNNLDKRKYRLIGTGTGRNVFDLDNGYVVKMAKNKKGVAQNKAEYKIATVNHSCFIAKITAVSDDYRLLIMEKAEKINSIAEVWHFYHVRNYRELLKQEEFRNLISQGNLLPADLQRRNSWGMVKGKPVIIDFGFTKEVSKYYSPFGFNRLHGLSDF